MMFMETLWRVSSRDIILSTAAKFDLATALATFEISPLKYVLSGFARVQRNRTATISDNLGESARDMLIFPIYFPT